MVTRTRNYTFVGLACRGKLRFSITRRMQSGKGGERLMDARSEYQKIL